MKKKSQLDRFYNRYISNHIHDFIIKSNEYNHFKKSRPEVNFTLEFMNKKIAILLKPSINYQSLFVDFENRYREDINNFTFANSDSSKKSILKRVGKKLIKIFSNKLHNVCMYLIRILIS